MELWPGRRRSRSRWISARSTGTRGGHPSMTTPIAGPCDSPQVEIVNSLPKVLPMLNRLYAKRRCCAGCDPAGRPVRSGIVRASWEETPIARSATLRAEVGRRGAALLRSSVLLAGLVIGSTSEARGAEGELIGYLPFSTVAPQDFAFDASDGSYWITAFLDQKIYHFSPGLAVELQNFAAPTPYPTGIVVNTHAGTLLVTGILSDKIVELAKDGSPTGREIVPELLPVVNPNSAPSPRGMAFDATGDAGFGSIYLVEGLGTLIYEIALDGRVLRSFSHPDDPDGYPGRGQTAATSDIDIIYENGNVAGFYVTGGRSRLSHIRRLDASGAYTGIAIPLEDAGGNVSGILRRPFEMPGAGTPEDSFLCVVEAPPRFAVLRGGEPDLREVLDFAYTSSGHTVEMTWRSPQIYERFEVVRGCEVIETLPGTATSWSRTFDTDGVYELARSEERRVGKEWRSR